MHRNRFHTRSSFVLEITTSVCGVMCQEPMIEALFPKFGPRSGGTQLSVHGRNLNIGSQLMVYASSRLCTVVRLQTHLVVDKIKKR